MALPLAFAISAVPAKADLARGEAEFLRGNAHCDAREFSDALASYDRAAAFGYEDHVMWNNRGVALDGLGRHEDSIQAYTRALQRNPKYEIAAYNLGNAFAQLGQFEEALVAYDRALAINPAYADALYDKALVLARLGRARPSLQVYEALVRADSGNAVAWTRKGQLLEELNKFDEAVDAYNAATSQNPEDGDAWTGLGDALYALERYEEAVEAYDRAIAAEPNNEEAWNNKGFTFFMLGIHEEALACYEKALAINPRYKQAWYNKGYTFHGINRLEEAVTAYEKAIEMDRGDEVLWNNLGNALYNTLILNGSFDEAWVFRGKILEEMGNALEAERCYEEALQCFYASLEIEPDNAELRYHQAVLLEDLERVDEAIDGYAASASKAHGADALIRLSALLLRVGRPGDAIVPAEELRSRDPSDSRGWLAAGRAFLAAGRATDAEASLRKAADLGAAEARPELARTLRVLGRADDALAALDGIEAASGETLLLRAEIHAGLGRIGDAIADCDAAIRATEIGRDLVYRRKGELLLRLNRPKEAVAAFDAAIGLNPTDPETWCDAARAWRALGQEARARKMVDQALRLDPTSSQALDMRSEGAASS